MGCIKSKPLTIEQQIQILDKQMHNDMIKYVKLNLVQHILECDKKKKQEISENVEQSK